MSYPLAIAHRAGNSLGALRAAADLGADVVEADVQDIAGTLEVHHLRSLHPLPLLWDRFTVSRLRSRRLTLAELLAAAPAGLPVMLDLKGRADAVGARVIEALHEHAPDRDVLVCGRHWPAVAAFVGQPWARTVLSARTPEELAALRPRVAADAAAGHRHYGVSIHRSLVRADLVAELHASVDVVMTWPINDARTLDTVLGHRVRGVICDDLDVVRRVVADRRA